MKEVFVCQVFHPDEQATSQLFSDLLAALAARGRSHEVLCGHPAGGRPAAGTELWRGVRIRRGGWRVDAKRNMAWRAVGYGSFSLWLVWRLLFCTPAAARVLVVTNPPFAPVLVWLCSRLRSWRYDVFLLDVYPDGLVAVGGLGAGSLIATCWRSLNRRALAAAGRVLVLGRDMAELVGSRYAVPATKVEYLPHWSSHASAERMPAEATRLWSRLGLRARFVVQYSGNMGLWHDLETIVRAADLLRDEPDIHFLMIGAGIRRRTAEALARELALPNLTWLPYQPKAELDDSLACCHAALISQRAGLEGVAVPCKLYGILASGRAVLAQVPADSETARVVCEEQCGLVIPPGAAHALADAIRVLGRDSRRTEGMGENAFAAYRAKYTLDTAVARYAALSAEGTLR